MRVVFLAMAIGLLAVGCETPIFSRSEVVGSYVANYPGAVDVLVLRGDSTFSQWYYGEHDDSMVTLCSTGHWSFILKDGFDSYIGFDSFYQGYTGDEEDVIGPTSFRAPAIRLRFRTVIALDLDNKYGFLKEDFSKPPQAVFDSLVTLSKKECGLAN